MCVLIFDFFFIFFLLPRIFCERNYPPPNPNLFYDHIQDVDPHQIGSWAEGNSVPVRVGFYIESLSEINPTEMSFEVDLYLRQSWLDSRLRHGEKRHFTIRDENCTSKIWVPDLYFANAKSASFQYVMKSNQLLLIYPDGHVHYSARIISVVACNLDLHNYPLDKQTCSIRLMSYAHPAREIEFEWFANSPITINPEIRLPEMSVIGVNSSVCNATYTYGQTETTELIERFSCLLGVIYFKRAIGYHMVQTYIPTCLIVVISWISFWIDPAAIPARISLSFTTLLTLATMTAGIRTALPPVSYAKAIDYWIGVCVLFVFGALLEFAFVSSFVRRAARIGGGEESGEPQSNISRIPSCKAVEELTLRSEDAEQSFLGQEGDVFVNHTEGNCASVVVQSGAKQRFTLPSSTSLYSHRGTKRLHLLREKYRRIAKYSDMGSRFIFPFCFLMFNAAYWFTFYDWD